MKRKIADFIASIIWLFGGCTWLYSFVTEKEIYALIISILCYFLFGINLYKYIEGK